MSRCRSAGPTAFLLAAMGALAACAIACSAPIPAQPTAPTSPFPSRPYPIDVTKIDPCAALTEDQVRQRGAQEGTPGTADVGVGKPSKACGWNNVDEGYGYNVQTIEAGASVALPMPGSSVAVIDGFGAVLNVPGETAYTGPGVPLLCQMTLDVNANQSIRVQVQSDDTTTFGSAPEQQESCGRVQALAHDVLSTFASQQR